MRPKTRNCGAWTNRWASECTCWPPNAKNWPACARRMRREQPARWATPNRREENENQNRETTADELSSPAGQTLGTAPLRGWADTQIADGVFEPEEDLRKSPQRP